MNILDEIVARTRHDLVATKQAVPEFRLLEAIANRPPTRDFAAALRGDGCHAPRVIAELKRASPSRGLIREQFDAAGLAQGLAQHGAAALSVLTEEHYFQGSSDYLRTAAATVEIPVLRKDFIVDRYQLLQARAWGADAVLLIVRALSPAVLEALLSEAAALGLAVLCEIHDEDELGIALDAGAAVVGVNSRDLRTFKTDLSVTAALVQQIPASVVRVAESGIRTRADMDSLIAVGADAFLIGETLMRQAEPGRALTELIGA